MDPRRTQRFHVVIASDGDVHEREIGDILDALGYRGLLVLDQDRTDHEHPCPSTWCLEQLRAAGHVIPAGADCCVCWGAGLTASG
jgi:hypothetical protein